MRKQNDSARKLIGAMSLLVYVTSLLISEVFAQSETWTTKVRMPVPLTGMAAGVVDGKLYVAGGFDCTSGFRADTFAYDPKTDKWETREPMPTARSSAAGAVVDGISYVIGGNYEGPVAMAEAYNPKADTWTTKAPMPTARSGAAAGVVEGVIYVVGGSRFVIGAVATLEAYDPKTNTWTTIAPMPTARHAAVSGVIDGILYVAGGHTTGPGAATTNRVEAYDPKSNTWSTKAPMSIGPSGRYGAGAGVLDDMLYVAGGVGSHLFRDPGVVEAYDPKTNSWTREPSMPMDRFTPAAGVVDDVLYVVGGSNPHEDTPDACLAVNEAFTPFLFVGIDIKPGDGRNTINLKSHGIVSAAILGSAMFDPLTVDPETVTLAGAHVATRGRGVLMTSSRDVNRDGYPDLVLFFRTQDFELTPDSTEAVLYGTTYSGQRIRGADSVRLVPIPY